MLRQGGTLIHFDTITIHDGQPTEIAIDQLRHTYSARGAFARDGRVFVLSDGPGRCFRWSMFAADGVTARRDFGDMPVVGKLLRAAWEPQARMSAYLALPCWQLPRAGRVARTVSTVANWPGDNVR